MWLIIGLGLIVLFIGIRYWWVGRESESNRYTCGCGYDFHPSNLPPTRRLA